MSSSHGLLLTRRCKKVLASRIQLCNLPDDFVIHLAADAQVQEGAIATLVARIQMLDAKLSELRATTVGEGGADDKNAAEGDEASTVARRQRQRRERELGAELLQLRTLLLQHKCRQQVLSHQ